MRYQMYITKGYLQTFWHIHLISYGEQNQRKVADLSADLS